MHGLHGEQKGLSRTHRRRGYSLIELAAAIAIFGALAGVVTLAIARAQLSATTTRYERQVSDVVGSYVDQAATSEYSTLVDGSYPRPNSCDDDASMSCATVWGRDIRISWNVTSSQDPLRQSSDASMSLQLTASAALSTGRTITSGRTVVAPSAAWLPGEGVLRVQVSGDGFEGRLYLLNSAGEAVASADAVAGIAVFRLSSTRCSSAAPCRIALSSSGGWRTEGWTIDAVSATGRNKIALTAGAVSDAAISVTHPASLTVMLRAKNDNGASSTPTVAGSVCLWAALNDGTGQRNISACNSDRSDRVTFSEYSINGSSQLLPIAGRSVLQLSADSASGACPSVDGMRVYDGGWVDGATCTSWTWGSPSSLVLGSATQSFGKAIRVVEDTKVTAVWEGSGSRPATGYVNEPRWSKPRTAETCSATATCVPLSTIPESILCPSAHCLSDAVAAPSLVGPSYGTYGIHSVAVTAGDTTTFSISAISTDAGSSDGTSVSIAQLPAGGVLRDLEENVLSEGDSLFGYTGRTGTASFQFVADGGFNHSTMIIQLSGPGGTRNERIVLTEGIIPVLVIADPARVYQNGSGALSVTIIGSDGDVMSGATVSVGNGPSGVAFSQAVTNSSGTATLTATAGAASAGSSTLTATASKSGVSASSDFNMKVLQKVTQISVTTGTVGQGATAPVVISATDATGAAMVDGIISLDVLDGAAGAIGVRVKPAGCVTGTNGSCSAVLSADPGASTREYTLNASNGGVSASTVFSVAPQVRKVFISQGSIMQGGGVDIVASVVDGTGAPMSGVLVTAAVGSGLSASVQGSTDSNGRTTIHLSATNNATAGARSITVTAGTKQVIGSVKVTTRVTYVEGSSATLVVGSYGQVRIVAHDISGRAVPNADLYLSAPSGLSLPAMVRTGSDGSVRFSVRVPGDYAAGPRQVMVSWNEIEVGAFTIPIVYSARVLTAANTLNKNLTSQDLGVLLRDANGSPVGNKVVSLSSNTIGVSIVGACVTDASGVCHVTVNFTKDLPAQLLTFSARIDGLPSAVVVNVK